MNIVEKIENENIRKDIPNFRPGDTVKVHCKIKEGDKERIQIFEGVCIRRRKGGNNASFTVRKHSYGVGVERVFPVNSPQVSRVEVSSAGKVRRSRLYYLRNLSGKAARIQGRKWEDVRDAVVQEEFAAEPEPKAEEAEQKADEAAESN